MVQAQPHCRHCKGTTTSAWRRGPLGPKTLCNACWVHLKRCKDNDCVRCTRPSSLSDLDVKARRTSDDDDDDDDDDEQLSDQPGIIELPDSPANHEPESDVDGPTSDVEPLQNPADLAAGKAGGSEAHEVCSSSSRQPATLLQPAEGVASEPECDSHEAEDGTGPAANDSMAQQDPLSAADRLRLNRNIAAELPGHRSQVRPCCLLCALIMAFR